MSEYVMINGRPLASFIDRTVLKPEAQGSEVVRLCEGSVWFRFVSVCVNPRWVPLVTNKLKGGGVLTCCVVGFSLGSTPTECAALEAELCRRNGADEGDMVIDLGALKDKDFNAVRGDTGNVKKACGNRWESRSLAVSAPRPTHWPWSRRGPRASAPAQGSRSPGTRGRPGRCELGGSSTIITLWR